MAKSIRIDLKNGGSMEFRASLIRSVHVRSYPDHVCVTEKWLFGKQQPVECFYHRDTKSIREDRCRLCEAVNPTQRKDKGRLERAA